MNYEIERIIENQQIVSIYCDYTNPDSHLTGYIEAVDGDCLLIDHISPNGYYDGYILVRQSDVYRIDISGKYEVKIERLYKYRCQTHKSIPREQMLIFDVLSWASSNSHMISVEVGGAMITGLVDRFESNTLKMNVFDLFGEHNGECVIKLEEIRSIAVNTSTEEDVNLLALTKE